MLFVAGCVGMHWCSKEACPLVCNATAPRQHSVVLTAFWRRDETLPQLVISFYFNYSRDYSNFARRSLGMVFSLFAALLHISKEVLCGVFRVRSELSGRRNSDVDLRVEFMLATRFSTE